MSLFFTSDTHFGHSNIIKYTGRPYKNAWEMDEALIENWNRVVQPDDTVYHLGDVGFCSPARLLSILNRLNGTINLVFGNHDRRIWEVQSRFAAMNLMDEVRVPDKDATRGVQQIVLCHYAMRVWNKRHWGAWQLYGHSHGSLPDDPNSKSLDVGVDCWGYTPVSYDQIKQKMAEKLNRPVDHHERDD